MRFEATRYRAVLSMLPLGAIVSMANAHALLDHADPGVGSVVTVSPANLSLRFTQAVEPAFSKIEVRDLNGTRVDDGSAQADSTDATLLRITLKPLPVGTYYVNWKILSADTHTTQGHFQFDISK